MKLGSVLGFSDADRIEGDGSDHQRAEHDRQVREARLTLARGRTTWTEIPETRLVRRGPFLVDTEDDALYTLRRGVVFEPGRAVIGFVPDNKPMTYFVDRDDDIVFLDRHPHAATWSEVVARNARRGATPK